MVRVQGERFVDGQGRTLLLRGVNLAGSSKVPRVPDGASWRRDGFYDHRTVSFVGRPFPLDGADAHFARLRRWGLTTLRFLVTWEAVEHRGPRQYDAEYLDYLEAVTRKAGEHGLTVLIDFHQDVWSRFTGGDGAPGWTLEAVGFQLEHLHQTGAALVHCEHDGPLPRMVWPTNANKLGAATMFTLFFGGDTFAPNRRIDGVGVQRFLQEHFFGAVEQVARRLASVPCVFGYDVFNEPSPGYIGYGALDRPFGLEVGPRPSPLQSMALASGESSVVDVWHRGIFGPWVTRRDRLNKDRRRAWRDGAQCIWAEHGVWEPGPHGKPRLLRPRHFAEVDGRPADFNADFYRPFLREAVRRLQTASPGTAVMVESVPQRHGPAWTRDDGDNVAYAPHWYDGTTLFLKDFWSWVGVDFFTEKVVLGRRRIRKSYADQLRRLGRHAHEAMGGLPVLVGELGVPFDLQHGRAFRTGNFELATRAMDRSLTAVEDALVSACLWNYTPDNTHAHGDGWNDEDLSIFSLDGNSQPDSDSGGRALDAVVRPYPMAVPGTLVRYRFDRATRHFELVFRHAPGIEGGTDIFLPTRHYPTGLRVECSDGGVHHDAIAQVLHYFHDPLVAEHRLTVDPPTKPRPFGLG